MQTITSVHTDYAGAIIWQSNGGGIELLLIDSEPVQGEELPVWEDGTKKTKFPGGTNKERPTEPVLETLRREIFEETDLHLPTKCVPEQIHQDERRYHTKTFYIVEFKDLVGEMRLVRKRDGPYWLSKPYWMAAQEVSRRLHQSHHKALGQALWCLGIK